MKTHNSSPYASRWQTTCLTLCAVMFLGLFTSQAADKNWNGSDSGLWNDPDNWTPAGAPANGDRLFFPVPGGGAFTTTTNNLANRRFQSITFFSGGYTLRGNSITVSNGVTAANGAGANTIDFDLALGASQTFSSDSTFTLSGDVNLASFTLTVSATEAADVITFSGAVTNTGNLIKIGDGIARITGTNNNTYTGTTTVSAGTLRVLKNDGVTSVPGDLTVSAGASVVWFTDNQLANTSDVTLGSGATLDLNGHTDTIGALTATTATVDLGGGTLTLGGNVTVSGATTTVLAPGTLSLGPISRTIDVGSGANLSIPANLAGGSRLILGTFIFAGFTKEGTGTLTLAGTNTYGGSTLINAGQINANSDTAFGAISVLLGTPGVVTINPAGHITLGSADIGDKSLIINRPDSGIALSASGLSSWSGPVTLNTNVLFTTGGTLAFSNNITGPGGLTLQSTVAAAVFRFAGTNGNDYLGNTTLNDGRLELAKEASTVAIRNGSLQIGDGDNTDEVRELAGNQIFTSVNINFDSSGVLNLNNFNDDVGSLTFNGGTVNTGTGTITPDNITVNPASVTAAINGELNLAGTRTWTINDGAADPDLIVNAVISGSGSLIKNGDGQLELHAANLYTGTTIINAGEVRIFNNTALGPVAGTGTTVNDGGTLVLELPLTTISEPLTIAGFGTGGTNGALRGVASATTTIATNVVLGSSAMIFVDTSGGVTINGSISGTGDLTKNGAGTLTLAGSPANSFSGDLFARQGTVNLSKSSGAAIPHDLSIGLNGLIIGPIAARVNNLATAQIGGAVTVNGTGTYDVNTFTESIAGLAFNDGGDVIIDAGGELELFSGSLTTSSSLFGGTATISGAGEFRVSSGTRTFNIPEGSGLILGDATELIISAHVIGTASITKTGSGDVSLTASNSFTGTLTINDGEVRISNDHALGTTTGATLVNGDGVLSLSGSIDVAGESLTLNSTGQPANGALESASGTNSWSGPVSLTQTAVINVETNSSLTLSGVINGGGGVTKIGPGTLVFSGGGANTYAGTTTLNEGVLECRKTGSDAAIPGHIIVGDGIGGANADRLLTIGPGSGQINDNARVTVNSSGRWELSIGETIGSLEGSGNVDLNSSPLLTGGDGSSTTFDGIISGAAASAFNKTGTGTMTLNGDNTYSGPTSISSAGTLLINGSQPDSDVTVNSGATLGGNGSIGNLDVNNLGNLAPGASPGRLISKNTKLDPGSNFRVELNGPARATGYDQLEVIGTVDLNGALLLPTKGPDYAPTDGDVLVIVNNNLADAVTGAFGGRPEGSIVTLGGIQFVLSYVGGTGNDVTLTVTNIPLHDVGVSVAAGNGNGVIDVNECNTLFIGLENKTGSAVTGVSARLDSKTPGVLVTQQESAYPNIPALNVRSNSTPFQIRTLPSFACGRNVELLLTVSTAGSTFTVPLSIASGSAGAFVTLNSTNIPKQVFDLSSTNSIIIVTNNFFIAKARVSLHATHPAAGDLKFTLISPTGTEIVLSANRGGTGNNYGNSCAQRTTFDDDGSNKIAAGSAPFLGTFAPEEPLGAVIGESSAGTWTLRVEDTVPPDGGVLQCWSLSLAPATCTDGGGGCESCLATVSGILSSNSPTMDARVSRSGVVDSFCGTPKLFRGTISPGPFRYAVHKFGNNGPATCVTVLLRNSCGTASHALSAAAYLSFDPTDVSANYLGDSSLLGVLDAGFSFRVPANSLFFVEVNDVTTGSLCDDYTLEVYGLPCPPPELNIATDAGPNKVRLFWSTAYPDFHLQAVNRLNPPPAPPFPFANVAAAPFVVNGQFNVTNNITTPERYFRLIKP